MLYSYINIRKRDKQKALLEKENYIMTRSSIHKKDRRVLILSVTSNRASKYIKQNCKNQHGEMDKFIS